MSEPRSSMRRDGDTWDILHGVGETALGMATARAHETESREALFTDPYAKRFVDAARSLGWQPPRRGVDVRTVALLNYAACRTRYFDEFFTRAGADGIAQIINVGAGLDSRAWRLALPHSVVVYEIDQPAILDFKLRVLAGTGAEPACVVRPVRVDLRADWPTALRNAGFDASRRSVWSVEGLLAYLPPEGQDLLFGRIQDLAASGSRLAVEADTARALDPESAARRRANPRELRDSSATAGRTFLREVSALWYKGRRRYLGEWLAEHGWNPTAIEAGELMRQCGRAPSADIGNVTPRSEFIQAERRKKVGT